MTDPASRCDAIITSHRTLPANEVDELPAYLRSL